MEEDVHRGFCIVFASPGGLFLNVNFRMRANQV